MRMTSCPLHYLISPRVVENLNRNASSKKWMDSEEVFKTALLFIFLLNAKGVRAARTSSSPCLLQPESSRCTSAQMWGPQPRTSKQQPT